MEPSKGRLQRTTGHKITRYSEVIFRHGLPGWLLAAILVIPSELNKVFLSQIQRFMAEPQAYVTGGFVILVLITFASWNRTRTLNIVQASWIGYLLLVSAAEEWIFRVVGPLLLGDTGLSFLQAVVVCNLIFGAMHYFTLRWKAQWCLMAFVGGMGFSYSFAQHGDLFAIIGIHWLVTFFNTPTPPGQRSES